VLDPKSECRMQIRMQIALCEFEKKILPEKDSSFVVSKKSEKGENERDNVK
jgi:hypothetical protein